MRFHLTADATFDAHSIDDAFGQLTQHFADLMGGQLDGNELDFEGSISIEPADQPDIEPIAIVKRGWWRRLADAVGSRA
jgi:hypothetical protein